VIGESLSAYYCFFSDGRKMNAYRYDSQWKLSQTCSGGSLYVYSHRLSLFRLSALTKQRVGILEGGPLKSCWLCCCLWGGGWALLPWWGKILPPGVRATVDTCLEAASVCLPVKSLEGGRRKVTSHTFYRLRTDIY